MIRMSHPHRTSGHSHTLHSHTIQSHTSHHHKILSHTYHECSLSLKGTSGLPKLPPNATWRQRTIRCFRQMVLMSPNHFKCKELFRNRSAVIAERKKHATGPYYFVIHPLSVCDLFIQVVFFTAWVFCLITDPLAAFMRKTSNDDVRLVQTYVLVPVRLIVIALQFNVGYIDKKSGRIVMESKTIMWKYLKTYFIFDVLSTHLIHGIVRYMYIHHVDLSERTFSNLFLATHVSRMLCIFVRINTLLQLLDSFLSQLMFRQRLRTILVCIFKTLIYIHIFSYILYDIPLLVYSYHPPKESWIH